STAAWRCSGRGPRWHRRRPSPLPNGPCRARRRRRCGPRHPGRRRRRCANRQTTGREGAMSNHREPPTGQPLGAPAAAEPGTPADPGRYVWHQRVVAILLMVAAILVAGGIARAATALDEADDRLFTDVEQGQAIRIGERSTLR